MVASMGKERVEGSETLSRRPTVAHWGCTGGLHRPGAVGGASGSLCLSFLICTWGQGRLLRELL